MLLFVLSSNSLQGKHGSAVTGLGSSVVPFIDPPADIKLDNHSQKFLSSVAVTLYCVAFKLTSSTTTDGCICNCYFYLAFYPPNYRKFSIEFEQGC